AIEIARTLRPSRAIGILDAALRSGHCSPNGLEHAMRLQTGRRGIVHVRHLLAYADGRSESPMESETRLLFVDAGIPVPELQATISDRYGTRWRVDFLWRSARLIGEYDSDEWHSGSVAMRQDKLRTARLQECGWTVLPITVDDVRRRPRELIARIKTHLRHQAA
ncbi:cullin, a subunit of E3 ubiquitin ligase, partial [Aduncisulcus paluster]